MAISAIDTNPPEAIRDYNRTMEENGDPHRMSWDMMDHNREIAEALAPGFAWSEAQSAPLEDQAASAEIL